MWGQSKQQAGIEAGILDLLQKSVHERKRENERRERGSGLSGDSEQETFLDKTEETLQQLSVVGVGTVAVVTSCLWIVARGGRECHERHLSFAIFFPESNHSTHLDTFLCGNKLCSFLLPTGPNSVLWTDLPPPLPPGLIILWCLLF